MDPYTEIVTYLARLRPVRNWPEMLELIQERASLKSQHWCLPLLACEAVGSATERALPAAAAVACAHTSIILLDDMLDADSFGLYRRLGMPVTANLSAALQALSLHALASCDLVPALKRAAQESLNNAFLLTAFGQHLDIHELLDEAGYWRVTRLKSAPFFSAAFHIGALMGSAPAPTARVLHQFGQLYGEIVQIHDDLKDVLARPAGPDWDAGRAPLPILFAETVNHPQRKRFATLRQRVTEPAALLEAQQILIQCGAVSYCLDQALVRHRKLRRMLSTIPLQAPTPLEERLDALLMPVQTLIDGVSAPRAASEQSKRLSDHLTSCPQSDQTA